MGRLEHLKLSLPKMLQCGGQEVIVVDYSCPDGTAGYVTKHFPSVRVVSVEGEKHFSNWRARNAGAELARTDVLVFCDADTLLADHAITWLDENLRPKTFGLFSRALSAGFNAPSPGLALNQLRGFHVIPRTAFRRIGGYDDVLEGYAAGGDTDLEERLMRTGLERFFLDTRRLVASMIEHDDTERLKYHLHGVSTSYCAGLLYRAAKTQLLRLSTRLELPRSTRQTLYAAAREAAASLGSKQDSVAMTVSVDKQKILMPRQLGYENGSLKVSIRVEIEMQNKIGRSP